MKQLLVCCLLIISSLIAQSQNTRIRDNNTIGWYAFTGTFKLKDKWSLHTEYQWRRHELLANWQQGLLRTGINYQLNPNVTFRVGYAWAETYNYGDIPINAFGKQFTEHRAYEMALLSNKIGIVDFSHRFMLEQRWIGRYADASQTKESDFVFANRARYMYRMQVPLKGKSIADKTPYAAAYDEIFIGFGENVNENIFDQNRVGLLLGYKFSSKFRVEAGFLSQMVLLGREVNNRSVIQYNNGLIVSTSLNL